MDYLDPKKQKAHMVRLIIGYILVGIALILTTIILLYQAYGFGFKNGEIIQNGLIFVSSKPKPADIYINNERNEKTTNTRLLIPAGQYNFRLERDGYRPWRRAISLEGGSLIRFDYPILFPTKLVTEAAKRYDTKPAIVTQSLDQRWMIVQANPGAYNTFDLFDLNDPKEAPVAITVPSTIFDHTAGAHSWKLVEWASDNRHVLLQHGISDGSTEYILVDREAPQESVNITRTLGTNPSEIQLLDKKYDKYFIYDKATRNVSTATLSEPAPKLLLGGVIDFKTHDDDVILYATEDAAAEGKVAINLREGDKTYPIRQVAKGDKYLLDLARYEDAWYVVAGAPTDNRTYVYRDPAHALRSKPDKPLVPVQVLKAINPQYVSFSDNARFMMSQGGQQIAVYDAETDKGYTYTVAAPIDAPQEHAVWMDGHHMMFVSKSKAYVFDFDDANRETLAAASADYVPLFDRDFESMYTLALQTTKAADGSEVTQYIVNRTALRTPKDQ